MKNLWKTPYGPRCHFVLAAIAASTAISAATAPRVARADDQCTTSGSPADWCATQCVAPVVCIDAKTRAPLCSAPLPTLRRGDEFSVLVIGDTHTVDASTAQLAFNKVLPPDPPRPPPPAPKEPAAVPPKPPKPPAKAADAAPAAAPAPCLGVVLKGVYAIPLETSASKVDVNVKTGGAVGSFAVPIEQTCETSSTVEALCRTECADASTLCFDASTRQPLCPGPAKTIRVGQEISAVVFGDTNQLTKSDVHIAFNQIMNPDTLFPKPIAPMVAPGAKPCLGVVASSTYQVPNDDKLLSLSVSITVKGLARTTNIPVDHGKFWIEVGLLMPFVPLGTRSVVPRPIPGTGLSNIGVTQDLKATPAVALNFFPAGRRRALLAPFQGGDTGRAIMELLLGLQGGVGLDLTTGPSFYFGSDIEPIAGLGFNLGIALVRGQFVPQNYAQRMLLPTGETLTPDTNYIARFYFGFTASTDIVTTLSSAFGQAKGFVF
jgi:hypothetical protein